MIVVVQTRGLESFSLCGSEHSQRRTGLESQLFDTGHELGNLRDFLVLGRTPRCSHAKASRTGRSGFLGLSEHHLFSHEPLRCQARVEMRALGTVRTVFRAAAGLNRQQGRYLDNVSVEMGAVHRLGLINQVVKRYLVQRQHFIGRPIMTAVRAIVHGSLRFAVENHARPLYIALG